MFRGRFCRCLLKLTPLLPDSGDWVVFSGGMPRASYGDKHTVSVLQRDAQREEQKHVAFDFTSAVVDFALLGGEGPGQWRKQGVSGGLRKTHNLGTTSRLWCSLGL